MNKYGLDLDNQRLINEKKKFKHYCKCGYSVTIYPFEKHQKKLCAWCGNYIYSSKQEEFKDKLRKAGIKYE